MNFVFLCAIYYPSLNDVDSAHYNFPIFVPFHHEKTRNDTALSDSKDILARRNRIKDCVAAARMEDAIKHFIDFTRDFLILREDDIILLSMDYHDLRGEEMRGTIEAKEAKLMQRQLARRLLMTLNDIFKQIQQAP